jgi:1-acyl-sn-glycerol-3-phosphate acyltransferase
LKKLANALLFLTVTYPFGILLGIFFWLGRFFGTIKVRGWENFPHWRGKVLVVANHPSLLEPFVLIGMFFHEFLFRPFKYGPWSMPDKKNFGGFLFRGFWPRFIFVERGNKREEAKALFRAAEVLNDGGILIVFPEGGRTGSGGNCERLSSSSGRRQIRKLENGGALLALRTEALVLPVWIGEDVEKVLPNVPGKLFSSFPRFWRSFSLTLGKPMLFPAGMEAVDVTRKIADTLLSLSDKSDE